MSGYVALARSWYYMNTTVWNNTIRYCIFNVQ